MAVVVLDIDQAGAQRVATRIMEQDGRAISPVADIV